MQDYAVLTDFIFVAVMIMINAHWLLTVTNEWVLSTAGTTREHFVKARK